MIPNCYLLNNFPIFRVGVGVSKKSRTFSLNLRAVATFRLFFWNSFTDKLARTGTLSAIISKLNSFGNPFYYLICRQKSTWKVRSLKHLFNKNFLQNRVVVNKIEWGDIRNNQVYAELYICAIFSDNRKLLLHYWFWCYSCISNITVLQIFIVLLLQE